MYTAFQASSHRLCWSSDMWEVPREEPEGKASHPPNLFQVISSIKQLFFPPPRSDISAVPSMWLRSLPNPQPVTVNGTVDTGLLLSGQGIEEGTGSLLSCLLLAWGLIPQMEKPMADWQHPSTRPPASSLTYSIPSLSHWLVLFSLRLCRTWSDEAVCAVLLLSLQHLLFS